MIKRYTLPEMGMIWTEENKFRKWLDVELAACQANAEAGNIPADVVEPIRQKAAFSIESPRTDALLDRIPTDDLPPFERHFAGFLHSDVGSFREHRVDVLLTKASGDVADTRIAIRRGVATDLGPLCDALQQDADDLQQAIT